MKRHTMVGCLPSSGSPTRLTTSVLLAELQEEWCCPLYYVRSTRYGLISIYYLLPSHRRTSAGKMVSFITRTNAEEY
jgi:hypothetical protein